MKRELLNVWTFEQVSMDLRVLMAPHTMLYLPLVEDNIYIYILTGMNPSLSFYSLTVLPAGTLCPLSQRSTCQ